MQSVVGMKRSANERGLDESDEDDNTIESPSNQAHFSDEEDSKEVAFESEEARTQALLSKYVCDGALYDPNLTFKEFRTRHLMIPIHRPILYDPPLI